MAAQTNLEEVKITAQCLLMTEVHKTDLSPIIVQHPFTSLGITMLPGTNEMLDITANAENLKKWRDYVGGLIKKAKTAYDIFMLLNKGYAMTFLKFAKYALSDEDLAEILADAWVQAENPNMDCNVTKAELVSMFKRSDKAYLMTETERRRLAELEETVTVYRGVTPYNAMNVKALSWTLDKKKAEWFAHRFGEKGTVYTAQIKKGDILAVFTGRNESEVVLNPSKLEQLKAI